MNQYNKKAFLGLVASATEIICLIVLFFFKTSIFSGALHQVIYILTPFIYGAVIAYLLRPIALTFEKWLSRRLDKAGTKKRQGAIRMAAILLSLVLLFVLVFLLLMAVIPEMINSISGLLGQLPETVGRFEEWLASKDNGEMSHEIITSIQSALDTLTEWLAGFLNTDILPQLTGHG